MQTIIGSSNGLLSVGFQAINWTSAGVLLTAYVETNFNDQWNLNANMTILVQGNDFEVVICKILTALSPPLYV